MSPSHGTTVDGVAYVSVLKAVHEQGAWIEDLLPQGVWKWFVEQLAPLHLLVSWNESLWNPRALTARSFHPLASSFQIRYAARGYHLVSAVPNIF
ncbi:hypothetical protein AVEN_229842-1 [Araneus ventricosus]|uniref:Uncharacterized protein n=1 Tax=Araneus ventricosus TaxID=182803 RepID=A0A4Y2S294_ARAVE|nr:hypothetical protein AVEN_229842-1 [Araneus ventricosus]